MNLRADPQQRRVMLNFLHDLNNLLNQNFYAGRFHGHVGGKTVVINMYHLQSIPFLQNICGSFTLFNTFFIVSLPDPPAYFQSLSKLLPLFPFPNHSFFSPTLPLPMLILPSPSYTPHSIPPITSSYPTSQPLYTGCSLNIVFFRRS